MLTAIDGSIGNTDIQVRLHAGTTGTFNGSISHVSAVGAVVSIAVNGTASATTGIPDVEFRNGFTLYPNPAGDRLHISHAAAARDLVFTLYSAAGERLLTRKARIGNRETIINLQQLPAGTYFLQVSSAGKKALVSFVHF